VLIEVAVEFRLCRGEDLLALEWMGLHTRERDIIRATFERQRQGDALMLLALANGFPIGQVWIDFIRSGPPRLWAVRVFPPLQRAGLGRRMMGEAETLARARGAAAVELGVERENPQARSFYENLGYRPVGRERELVRYSFEGQDLTMEVDQEIMRKSLRHASDPMSMGLPGR
jgi:ribosomal protein S18 acetylase RimI-like enzyme